MKLLHLRTPEGSAGAVEQAEGSAGAAVEPRVVAPHCQWKMKKVFAHCERGSAVIIITALLLWLVGLCSNCVNNCHNA